MNSSHPYFGQPGLNPLGSESAFGGARGDDGIDLGHYLSALWNYKWFILGVTALAAVLGAGYATLQQPVYESNLVIQVEDAEGTSKGYLGEASSLLDTKTPASAEVEIVRSRAVIGAAVDATQLDVVAHPRHAPYVGQWLSRRASGLSQPGFLGMPGYTTGTERIVVGRFELPEALRSVRLSVTAQEDGNYLLNSEGWPEPVAGQVGIPLTVNTPQGPIELQIDTLAGKPGAQFVLWRASRLATVEGLQSRLQLSERGKQSGILNVTLRDENPVLLRDVLNAIGTQYVRQNVERRAAEAQKALNFLDVQLPVFKRQLEDAEEAYNRYRNQKGTVAFTEEASLILGTAVDRQTRLLDAQQRRRDLEARFTPDHPSMRTLDAQIAALNRDIADVQGRIRGLPAVQQEAVRMERDVKVNTELYQSLLNNAMQLRLVKEGKVGNVRVLDEAVVPLGPVKPQPKVIVAASLALGLLLGVVLALVRNALVEQRIRDPHEVESNSGLPVFSSIPTSTAQARIGTRRLTGATGVRLLAIEKPDDPVIESLRSLRTAMQFAMLEAPDNRVMISGPTPGVGKSFVAANFAALMAAAGRRTLLIDADLRRGNLHHYLGLTRHGGLSELVAGTLTAVRTIHRQVVPNLDFLATGQLPPNPAELLTSESFAKVLESLSEKYDLVVMDTPPVLVASDTASIVRQVGTALLVARAGTTTMGEIKESTRRMALGGKPATGVLLNGMDLSRRGYGLQNYGRYRYTAYKYESVLPEAEAV